MDKLLKRLAREKRWSKEGLEEPKGYPSDVKSRSRVSRATHVADVQPK